MKYSIRGQLSTNDVTPVVNLINKYILWRFITTSEDDLFNFEAWVNTEADKNALYLALKPYVDELGEVIDWHICSHDEEVSQPCVIAEEYRG